MEHWSNYRVRIEIFKIGVGQSYTYETLNKIQTKITKKQFEKLLCYECVNTRIGFLVLERL